MDSKYALVVHTRLNAFQKLCTPLQPQLMQTQGSRMQMPHNQPNPARTRSQSALLRGKLNVYSKLTEPILN